MNEQCKSYTVQLNVQCTFNCTSYSLNPLQAPKRKLYFRYYEISEVDKYSHPSAVLHILLCITHNTFIQCHIITYLLSHLLSNKHQSRLIHTHLHYSPSSHSSSGDIAFSRASPKHCNLVPSHTQAITRVHTFKKILLSQLKSI